MTTPELNNENISLTAWPIAYLRTFTDIPYSKKIFENIEKLRHLQGIEIPKAFKCPKVAPQIEARYKLLRKLIAQNHVEQILEIAAGFSPRGLESTDNKSIVYVEIDLPEIVVQKINIIDTIGPRANLHIEKGSVFDLNSLQTATRYFNRSKPIGVIHEGLLRYLTFDQKAIVAKNIHALLDEFSGLWITPDISLKEIIKAEDAATQHQIEKVKRLIGINIDQNCFEDVVHAKRFFEDLGFSVERHGFMEVIDELSSPKALNQTKQDVETLIGEANVFVMNAKDK